jgi:hypothetical protein
LLKLQAKLSEREKKAEEEEKKERREKGNRRSKTEAVGARRTKEWVTMHSRDVSEKRGEKRKEGTRGKGEAKNTDGEGWGNVAWDGEEEADANGWESGKESREWK